MYIVYGKPACPFCVKAKSLLARKDLEYEYKDLTQHTDLLDLLISQGHRSVPQVFYGARHIGGYTELEKELS